MAFDRSDTEKLYSKGIVPVLRRLGITPIIVNRGENNDDLNRQIVDRLESCDLCIADLSHARQSVYFEAGYAQRAIPVIYSVRADHLRRNQPDEARVHFDLQMKPLLRWKTGFEPAFRKALESRIRRTFLRNWNRAQEQAEALSEGRHAFASMSVSNRLGAVRRTAIEMLATHGLREWQSLLGTGRPTSIVDQLVKQGRPLLSYTTRGNRGRVGLVLAVESARLSELQGLSRSVAFLGPFGIASPRRGPTFVQVHVLCLSLRALSRARVEGVFSSYAPGDRAGRLVHQIQFGASDGVPTSITTTLDCIGEINSLAELSATLKSAARSVFRATA